MNEFYHQVARGATADYSITTDGTLGTLGASNILGYNITLSDGTTPFSFSNTDGRVTFFLNPPLVATSFNLTYDFNSTSEIGFDGPPGESLTFLGNPGNTVLISTGGIVHVGSGNGVETIATVQAVPEPATWAMMIAGFGLVGSALRRRDKVVTTVRFA